ncbi:MAG: SagB/ThcOx family dehydrogenase [Candidatus Omnitrophica bacterium]|nr:SagB/ThcOx family dehydrogenase [Candidatus Omnitrophota bacterium]
MAGVLLLFFVFGKSGNADEENVVTESVVKLFQPRYEGSVSVEEAIMERRSVRDFARAPLTMKEISQILWASGGATLDGITGPTRAYPSAGAIYPLEIYLIAGDVTGLEPGIYRYDWKSHSLVLHKEGDFRDILARAASNQRMIQEAPATIVVASSYKKVERRYGERGALRYVSMDAGHLGQNVHLQTQSIGLGTVMVGAFTDDKVAEIIDLKDEVPIYMMPVGKPETH